MCPKEICGCKGSELALRCLYNSGEAIPELGVDKGDTGDIIIKKIGIAFTTLSQTVEENNPDFPTCVTPGTTETAKSTWILTFDCATEQLKFVQAKIIELT